MKKRVYFYTGNHEKSKSINSYLFLVKKKFNNYEIIPSIKIKKNSTNIVVEGFDKKQYLKITHNTGNNLKIILIVTEFLDNNFKTFNNFDKKKTLNIQFFI